MTLDVRDFIPADRAWAARLLSESGGGIPQMARLGELLDPLEHEGIVAERDGRPVALLTVHESERGLEVLTLHSEVEGIGAGSRLLETALRVAVASEAPRLWLVTTNDNLPAIRWYLRRGMRVVAVHPNAVEADRALKPQIPAVNPGNGIPIRDYVELELPTDAGEDLPFQAFPRIEDLDRLPPESAAFLLRTLFEDAPRFLRRLADARPFGDDAGLMRAARELARGLPEDEQIELLAAHPRIGADPAAVSDLSRAEQGYDDSAGAEPDQPWLAEELDALNDAYERIFGFRFVIFVAGRPRAAIAPILEASLRDERISELRRGLDDVVYIAADRLATLRSE
ncbi:MAG TPA: GNAT family N-acetyltransferase [Candidatus Limnocylindria bacterium]|nr:GNAT family N-acetyltransferase [Candidatus Limnocylindria bacterium]